MFDSKDIAKKALLRIEQINKIKRRRKLSIVATAVALCICAVSIMILIDNADPEIMISEQDPQTRYITDTNVPLANPPSEQTGICPECGMEIEVETGHCCYCELDEECELCPSGQ